MNVKRTAAMVGVGAAVIAWFASAMTPVTRQPTIIPPSKTSTTELRGEALAKEIARLHDRLRPDVSPSAPGRNLFTFRGATQKPPAVATAAPRAALTETPIARPQQPAFKLSGIAEDPGPDGRPVRTAIISGEGQLFLVKEGENVGSRYRVERISTDVVELADLQDGSIYRLALK